MKTKFLISGLQLGPSIVFWTEWRRSVIFHLTTKTIGITLKLQFAYLIAFWNKLMSSDEIGYITLNYKD